MDEAQCDYLQMLAEGETEFRGNDPVICNVGYRCFTSRSKGWHRGKKRYRRKWKEIELIRYQTGWHYPRLSQLDQVATELTGGLMSDNELLWFIRENCGATAGSTFPRGIK